MKTKWYFLTLVVSLTLLGFVQQEFCVPNQEIVVQFANDDLAEDERQAMLVDLQLELERIGAANIQLKEEGDHKLVISYFSTTASEEIKILLSEEFQISYTNSDDSSQHPSAPNTKDYRLDVHDLRSHNDFDADSKGVVFNINSENDRFNKPEHFTKAQLKNAIQLQRFDDVAFLTHHNKAVAIDRHSFKIPDVRAGPSYS